MRPTLIDQPSAAERYLLQVTRSGKLIVAK